MLKFKTSIKYWTDDIRGLWAYYGMEVALEQSIVADFRTGDPVLDYAGYLAWSDVIKAIEPSSVFVETTNIEDFLSNIPSFKIVDWNVDNTSTTDDPSESDNKYQRIDHSPIDTARKYISS